MTLTSSPSKELTPLGGRSPSSRSGTGAPCRTKNMGEPQHNVFGNKYYDKLLCGRTPFPLYQVMLSNLAIVATLPQIVHRFSDSYKDFFKNFTASMIEMGNICPLIERFGEIRTNYWRVNRKPYR